MVEAKPRKSLGCCVTVRNGTFIKEHERIYIQGKHGCLFVCDLFLPWLKNVSFLYLF